MPLETTDCRQDAVLWAVNGADARGNPTVSAAIALKVRWEDETREAVDENGAPIATVATVVVDRVVNVGSILWKGKLANVPSPTVDLFRVVTRRDTPDLKNRNVRRVLGLMKWMDALPTIT